jgi:hypothetical protein
MNDQSKNRIEQTAFFLTYLAKRHPAFITFSNDHGKWPLLNICYNTLRNALFIDVFDTLAFNKNRQKRRVILNASEIMFVSNKIVVICTHDGKNENTISVHLPIVLDETFIKWKQGHHHTYLDALDYIGVGEPVAGMPNR